MVACIEIMISEEEENRKLRLMISNNKNACRRKPRTE